MNKIKRVIARTKHRKYISKRIKAKNNSIIDGFKNTLGIDVSFLEKDQYINGDIYTDGLNFWDVFDTIENANNFLVDITIEEMENNLADYDKDVWNNFGFISERDSWFLAKELVLEYYKKTDPEYYDKARDIQHEIEINPIQYLVYDKDLFTINEGNYILYHTKS